MQPRKAQCSCGALKAVCIGDPVRISMCHCLHCQRRSGSAFSFNATFSAAKVEIAGAGSTYTHIGDEGRWGRFNFCPNCGVTLFYEIELRPGMISIPAGTFADPAFPPPTFSVYEERRHSWCMIGGDVERFE